MNGKSSSFRSGLYLGLAACVLMLGVVGVMPARQDLVVGAAIAAIGLGYLGGEAHRAARLRAEADAVLAAVVDPPEQLAWRVDELTSARERRTLARSLRGIVESLEMPRRLVALPVDRPAVSANRQAVIAIADRLAATERPVHPAGIVLVRELITDGLHSPLYEGSPDRLSRRLATLQRAIDRGSRSGCET